MSICICGYTTIDLIYTKNILVAAFALLSASHFAYFPAEGASVPRPKSPESPLATHEILGSMSLESSSISTQEKLLTPDHRLALREPTPFVTTEEIFLEAPRKKINTATASQKLYVSKKADVFSVPFYSQFDDITSAKWKKVGCGITSLAMLIDFYTSNPPSVDTLLTEGIAAHAYLDDAGWTYAGLIGVSKKYGFTGESYDLASSKMSSAFSQLETALQKGPVMVSVHYLFDKENPIPHLVVANGVKDGMVYYNDPAEKVGDQSISIQKFQTAWKKRYIDIHPIHFIPAKEPVLRFFCFLFTNKTLVLFGSNFAATRTRAVGIFVFVIARLACCWRLWFCIHIVCLM